MTHSPTPNSIYVLVAIYVLAIWNSSTVLIGGESLDRRIMLMAGYGGLFFGLLLLQIALDLVAIRLFLKPFRAGIFVIALGILTSLLSHLLFATVASKNLQAAKAAYIASHAPRAPQVAPTVMEIVFSSEGFMASIGLSLLAPLISAALVYSNRKYLEGMPPLTPFP